MSPATFRIQPVRSKRNHPSTCHSDRNEMEWRILPKWQALPYAGYYCNLRRFLHSADAAVGMTYRRVLPFIHTGYIRNVPGTAHRPFPTVSPKGGFFQPKGVVFVTLRGSAPHSESKSIDCRRQSHLDSIDESSPLHCVIPFIHTGYICSVPYGFADWSSFSTRVFQKSHVVHPTLRFLK